MDSNGDGSYTVTWGYKNPKHSKIKYDKDEAGLKIKRGTAIVLKKAEPTEFEPVSYTHLTLFSLGYHI